MRALVVCAVLAIVPPVARAAGPETEADTLIARGLELRRQEKQLEALDLFQRAHAVAPSPRTLGQMGLVEASLQLWTAAEDHVTAALATPSDPWVRTNSGFLTRALATAKGHVGELEIVGPAGTDISIDGKPAGSLPAVPVMRRSEGQVVVRATGVGFKDFAKTVSIAGGARTSLAIVLDPVDSRPAVALAPPVPLSPPPTPPRPVAEPQPRSWKTWTGGALAAAGAGLLVWGIVWIAVDGSNACSSVSGPDCGMVYDTKPAGWVLAGGGAAALSAGTILLVTGRASSDSDVAVGFTPTSLLVQGRF
jgi:hypothetical protein